jgi:WD40 repeat protein/tetratricopeptide (TPR) repeat protein
LLAGPLRNRGVVPTARFSPDGRQLLTSAANDPARVWDATTGKLLYELPSWNATWTGRFSPDGKLIVTAGADETAKVWDSATGRKLVEMHHAYFVDAAHFSSDGNRLVTASWDNTARVWDARTGAPLTPPLRHEAWVVDATFSPDGQRVVTNSKDNLARIWDAQTGEPLTHPFRYERDIPSWTSTKYIRKHEVYFTPDGQSVLTACWDNSARLWDVETGTPLTEPMRDQQEVVWTDLSPDGLLAVTTSADRSARLWDLHPGQMLSEALEHNGPVTSAQFSPDGQRVVTGSEDNSAWIWDARSGAPLAGPLQHDDFVLDARFSADGSKVATASYDHTARVWDAHTGKPLTDLLWHDAAVRSAQFSPDGQRLVTASDDGTARLWDIGIGQAIAVPLRHESNVVSAVFSPDGQQVLTTSRDKTARIWNARSGAPATKPLRHQDEVLAGSFSRDGQRVLTASADFTAQIWDARTGEPLAEMRHDDQVLAAEFSPDGAIVVTASADKTARLWDSASGLARAEPLRHNGAVTACAFSPDGQWIITASDDGAARVWDAHSGQPVTEWFRHGAPINSVQFAADGQSVITTSEDHSARVWELAPLETPVPDWLPRVAEAVAGERFGPQGILESVPAEQLLKLKTELLAVPANGPYRQWVHWFFDDRSNRTISPRSLIPVDEYVRRRTDWPPHYSFAASSAFYRPGYILTQTRENALRRLREVIRLSPSNHLAMARLARVLTEPVGTRSITNSRRAGDAEWFSRRALELAPDNPEVRWSRAHVLARLGRQREALDLVEKVVQAKPALPEARNVKGEALELDGRLDDACQAYTEAIRLAAALGDLARNSHTETLLERFFLLQRLGRPAEASIDFRAAKAELLHPVTIPPRSPSTRPNLIDLSPSINYLLTETYGWWPGKLKKDDFGALPTGIRTLPGAPDVEFDLRGIISLRHDFLQDKSKFPEQATSVVAGIGIGLACQKLHFLHAERSGGGPPTGTPIGHYLVHYTNGQQLEIPIRYGQDLADIVQRNDEEAPSYVVAWSGRVAQTKDNSELLRIFKMTWENPHPDWKIETLDAVATKADLHLFAITAE